MRNVMLRLYANSKTISLRCLVALISFIALAVVKPAVAFGQEPPPNVPSSPLSGAPLNFQTDPFTGQFSYSLPIEVPPARQGAETKIALSYKSGGMNGWAGVGWSIDTGRIERNSKFGVPIKWSSGSPLSEYDDTKGFVLSLGGKGGPLVSIGNDEFQLETEGDFLIVKFFRTSNYWEIRDKSGNKFYLGESTASRIENTRWSGSTDKTTFVWALNRVQDVNGNKTDITYVKNTGHLYPDTISYNGNVNSPAISSTHTVSFINELDGSSQPVIRADKSISYRMGFRAEQRYRLKHIETKVSGTLARRYTLAYTTSTSSTRSMLSSVTMYGSDGTTATPPLTFTYQQKAFEFGASETRGNLQGYSSEQQEGRIDYTETTFPQNTTFELLDIDADALPDRVLLKNYTIGTTEYSEWWMQKNNGSGFDSPTQITGYAPRYSMLCSTVYSTACDNRGFSTWVDLGAPRVHRATMADMNGDGKVDRVSTDPANLSSFSVALNEAGSLASPVSWTGVDSQGTSSEQYASLSRTVFSGSPPSSYVTVRLVDINGDGKADRVMMPSGDTTYGHFKVQLNTGSGFGSVITWGGVQGEHNSWPWSTIETVNSTGVAYVMFADLNGDGLPDRIMTESAASYDQFSVQFNNGSGFDAKEYWGPVDTQSDTSYGWAGIVSTYGGAQYCSLIDINGDGLVDRVMRKLNSPYSSLIAQLNTGSGFSSPVSFTGITGPSPNTDFWNSPTATSGDNYGDVRMNDINGDGLVDRIVSNRVSPYTSITVQTNKGSFPDLLSTVENGIGGKVTVEYVPSTTFANKDNAGKNLLPFVVQVVTNVYVDDGIGAVARTSYKFSGGFFDGVEKEFRGFHSVEVTDPTGAKTKTFYYQGGGYDLASWGEYSDASSHAKAGKPFRIDRYGTNGLVYSSTLIKIEEVQVHANGVWFPYISTTITLDFPGGSTTAYRATAQTMTYDTATGNVLSVQNVGEVTSVNQTTYAYTDVAALNVWTLTSYATFTNTDIRDKPASVVTSSTSLTSGRLREAKFFYDARGNLGTNQVWIDKTNIWQSGSTGFVTTSRTRYDTYGNPVESVDNLGVTNVITYDTTYKIYPVQSDLRSLDNAAKIFTIKKYFDPLSGNLTGSVDPNGVVATNFYDKLYRPTESWANSTAFAAATSSLWRTKISYNLGGVTSGVTANYVRTRIFDANDTTNGIESYAYTDGLGKLIQTRTESETNNVYRVNDEFHDTSGRAYLIIHPYFSSGTSFTGPSGTKIAVYNQFDPVGRAASITPAVNVSFSSWVPTISSVTQDTGSAVGASTVAHFEGTDPWVTVGTDPESKVTKTYRDEYGRAFHVAQVLNGSNVDTWFYFDRLGNMTGMYDPAMKYSYSYYNSLGWKLESFDPNLGGWFYYYDNAGRLIKQEDNEAQTVVHEFNDYFGRASAKKVYNSSSTLVSTSTYAYDTGVYLGHDVFKGQLAQVTDSEGQQYFGYDYQGRVLKSTRYLSKNSTYYTTTTTYNDAGQMSTFKYPSNVAGLQYYYTNGILAKIASTKGTGGSSEVFYQLVSVNEFGQAQKWYTHNNTVTNSVNFFAVSRRLQQIQSSKSGTNIQSISYTYDKASNVKGLSDAVNVGTASGTLNNISYDDLHRLTGLTYVGASQTRTFSYSTTGNLLVNQDFGVGTYTYGTSRPNAATAANGKTYSYNTNGDMTNRNGQTLEYTPERRLSRVHNSAASLDVRFGYSDGGARLWKEKIGSPNVVTYWIGDAFEVRGSLQLCHVFANGKRIATFQPDGTTEYSSTSPFDSAKMMAMTGGEKISRGIEWSFQEGRAEITAVISICVLLIALTVFFRIRQGEPLTLREARNFRVGWFHRTVAYVTAAAVLFVSTNSRVEAVTLNPVFLYYVKDHLGSSNITTTRTGEMVHLNQFRAYGPSRVAVNNDTGGFKIHNLFTDQIFDDETGLYYFNARYYDPELGQFVQPDTIVSDPGASQTLNRYAYAAGNPLKYVDPSGHFVVEMIIGAIVGAALGATIAAATGGDIAMGALTGAISGAIGALELGFVGGAISGGINAAITGGDIGMGALTGGLAAQFSGGGAGVSDPSTAMDDILGFVIASGTGAIGGGVGALFQGGNFWDGAANGAIGGSITYAITIDLPSAIKNSLSSTPRPHFFLDTLVDLGSLVYDLSQGNWGDAAISAGAMLVPGVPAPLAKAGAKVFIKAAQKPVIIGENMKRVNAYASKVNGETIDGWLAGRKWTQQLNDEFISTMKAQGRQFQDVGPDFGRRLQNRIDPSQGRPPSAVYGGERQSLLDYGNYQQLYERTGKYQGGVSGFDP